MYKRNSLKDSSVHVHIFLILNVFVCSVSNRSRRDAFDSTSSRFFEPSTLNTFTRLPNFLNFLAVLAEALTCSLFTDALLNVRVSGLSVYFATGIIFPCKLETYTRSPISRRPCLLTISPIYVSGMPMHRAPRSLCIIHTAHFIVVQINK